MTLDEFEELGNKGITEVTLKKEVFEAFCKSMYPSERSDEDGNKIPVSEQDIIAVHTTGGKIKINKEK